MTTTNIHAMSSLSSVEARLPPGFRFHPKDEELVCEYLMKWMVGCQRQIPVLIEVDLNKCEPWDIPETACVGRKEWYFYSRRDRKYATGLRTNRATVSGYWKATGKDKPVLRKGILVGMRKTLVFYQGRAPKGRKTYWVMHEFRLEETIGPNPKIVSSVKDNCVLCRVFYKDISGLSEAKQETDIPYDNEPSSSSPSLQVLMEPPRITFNQMINNQSNYEYNNQQVPCFFIFSTPNQTNPSLSSITHIKGSPSIGEGGSDCYDLSQMGLSSVWNNTINFS